MKITNGIEWIGAGTGNFEASVEFFRDVMGLALEHTGVATTDVQFKRFALFGMPNGVMLEVLEPKAEFSDLYQGVVVSFTVDDVQQARDELETRGIVFVAPVFETGKGWGWSYFRAPDGNVYQIQGPIKAPPSSPTDG